MGVLWSCFLVVFCIHLPLSRAADTVSRDRPLSGSQRLVSQGGYFALGFFQPDSTRTSGGWYLAIWYNKILKHTPAKLTPVWIANRAAPISDPNSSELRISEDGNLVLLSELRSLIWATNITNNISNSTVGVILDTGNFVLTPPSNSSHFLWQSFDEPTNMWLPEAKVGWNKITGQTTRFVSWQSSIDPSPGYYMLELDPDGSSQLICRWNNIETYWASGNWTGSMFSGVPEMAMYPKAAETFDVKLKGRESYFVYHTNASVTVAMLAMDVSGRAKTAVWSENIQDWVPFFALPKAQCSVYFVCGSFAMCTENAFTFCSCLRGFSKQYEGDWRYGDPDGGCTRNAKLQCDGESSNSSTKAKVDGFYTLLVSKLPEKAWSMAATSADGCKEACLDNCSCAAYFYGGGCSLWYGDLINLVSPVDGSMGQSIYIRLAASEFISGSTKTRSKQAAAIGAATGGTFLIAVILLVGVLLILRKRSFSKLNKVDGSLVVFKYRYLQSVTKNFSERLGKGSFGSVYKGTLPADGTLVAVKKLDGVSQGEKQFRAEVSTVGAIQHVNLIRLLGFCSERSMRMLVYEYMPNGSLERHLFGTIPMALSWKTRYQIALGIAEGLAYLHEKCRSRIIHCDIKPENVLLDASLVPRIADFGLAKLVGRDFSRVLTTMRGTVGYLAPEWISGTAITAKADVFSYGMMLFEIVSGKRNTEWHRQGEDIFFPVLVAMRLPQGDVQPLLDSELAVDADLKEVERACKVACWCVQHDDNTRPTMGEIVRALQGLVDIDLPPVPWYLHALAQHSTALH